MPDLPQTRRSLLIRLKQSSDHAWAEFLSVYEDAIYRFCRSKGLQDADARDVTQDVFSAVLDRIDAWDTDESKGSFRGWLLRAARNISVSRIRQRNRPEAQAAGDTLNLLTLAEVPDSRDDIAAFQFEYMRAAFQWAAQQVQEEVRRVTWQSFWMTAVKEEKPTDVAKALGISVGSVYTGKCRVVARLRDRVAMLAENDELNLDEQQLHRFYIED